MQQNSAIKCIDNALTRKTVVYTGREAIITRVPISLDSPLDPVRSLGMAVSVHWNGAEIVANLTITLKKVVPN